MIAALERCIIFLRSLDAAGCKLRSKVEDDYASIETDDPGIAREFGFVEVDDDS
jgi:hypothetical protein